MTTPSGRSERFVITANSFTIGRVSTSDVVIADESISRQHAVITRKGEDFVIRDTSSQAGVICRANRISGDFVLRHGDRFSIGQYTFDFYIGQHNDPSISAARTGVASGVWRRGSEWIKGATGDMWKGIKSIPEIAGLRSERRHLERLKSKLDGEQSDLLAELAHELHGKGWNDGRVFDQIHATMQSVSASREQEQKVKASQLERTAHLHAKRQQMSPEIESISAQFHAAREQHALLLTQIQALENAGKRTERRLAQCATTAAATEEASKPAALQAMDQARGELFSIQTQRVQTRGKLEQTTQAIDSLGRQLKQLEDQRREALAPIEKNIEAASVTQRQEQASQAALATKLRQLEREYGVIALQQGLPACVSADLAHRIHEDKEQEKRIADQLLTTEDKRQGAQSRIWQGCRGAAAIGGVVICLVVLGSALLHATARTPVAMPPPQESTYARACEHVGLVIVYCQYRSASEENLFECPLSTGTAFAVDANGLMMTNRHVANLDADDVKSLDAQFKQLGWRRTGEPRLRVCFGKNMSDRYDASVIYVSSRIDAALLRIQKRFGHPYAWNSQVEEGADLSVMGFPGTALDIGRAFESDSQIFARWKANQFRCESLLPESAFEVSMTRGILSAKRTMGNTRWLQTDATVNHGNSGGPMLDREGRWVGMVTMGSNMGEATNFGIDAKEIISEFTPWLSNPPK